MGLCKCGDSDGEGKDADAANEDRAALKLVGEGIPEKAGTGEGEGETDGVMKGESGGLRACCWYNSKPSSPLFAT